MGVASSLLAVSLALVASSPTTAGEQRVVLRDDAVRIGDLFTLTDVSPELRRQAGAVVLFRLPPSRNGMWIDRQDAWRRAVSLAPALAAASAPASGSIILVGPSQVTDAPAMTCLRLNVPIKAGAYPAAKDFSSADCPTEEARAAFQFEPRLGLTRASRDIAAGEIVQAPPSASLAAIPGGWTVFLETRVGAVVLQRDAVTVRPARPGASVIVRTRDGATFVAPMREDAK